MTVSSPADPGADGDLYADLNPNSETVLQECLVQPALSELAVGETVQFERLGYFCPDPGLDARTARLQAAPSASGTPGQSSRRRPPGHNDL